MPQEVISDKKKNPPWSYIILACLNVLAVLIFVIYIVNVQFGIFSRLSSVKSLSARPAIHHYKHKEIKLNKILLRVFVFAPKGDEAVIGDDWQNVLDKIFLKIKLAHQEQFFNLSKIDYVIYPEIIQGNFSSQYYDQEPLRMEAGGDERQLNLIADEINDRIKKKELNKIDFSALDYDYAINEIFYTGSNELAFASGIPLGYTNEIKNTNSSIIFWRPFDELEDFKKASVAYHEILHTLGAPEGYSHQNGDPYTSDIMGAGIYLPIEINYLSLEVKRKMGL